MLGKGWEAHSTANPMYYMLPLSVGSTLKLPSINASDSELLFSPDLPIPSSPYYSCVVPNHSHPLLTTYTSIQGSLLYALLTIP
jgi:hypothetical protein